MGVSKVSDGIAGGAVLAVANADAHALHAPETTRAARLLIAEALRPPESNRSRGDTLCRSQLFGHALSIIADTFPKTETRAPGTVDYLTIN